MPVPYAKWTLKICPVMPESRDKHNLDFQAEILYCAKKN